MLINHMALPAHLYSAFTYFVLSKVSPAIGVELIYRRNLEGPQSPRRPGYTYKMKSRLITEYRNYPDLAFKVRSRALLAH